MFKISMWYFRTVYRAMVWMPFLFLTILFLHGCDMEQDAFFAPGSNRTAGAQDAEWIRQLQLLQEHPASLMLEHDLYVQGFTEVAPLVNDLEKQAVIDRLLGADQYVPFYGGEDDGFQVLKLGDIPEEARSAITIDSLRMYLHKKLTGVIRQWELTWSFQGISFHSTCLVSDAEGLIYDHLLTNLMDVRIRSKPDELTGTRLKTLSEIEPFFCRLVQHGADCCWLWGADRGSAEIRIQVCGELHNGIPSFLSYSVAASHYMTLGSSDARYQVNGFQPGASGYLDVSWGWYMCTPLMDVIMEFVGGDVTFTMTGTGSEAHEGGRDYLVPGQ